MPSVVQQLSLKLADSINVHRMLLRGLETPRRLVCSEKMSTLACHDLNKNIRQEVMHCQNAAVLMQTAFFCDDDSCSKSASDKINCRNSGWTNRAGTFMTLSEKLLNCLFSNNRSWCRASIRCAVLSHMNAQRPRMSFITQRSRTTLRRSSMAIAT